MRLTGNRNSRWAVWDRFVVPNYDGDGDYLTRIRVFQSPLFGIYLHKLDGPDPRTTLHCHPWSFLSFVLRGGYVERRLNAKTMEVDEHVVVTRVNAKRSHNAHAITSLLRVPTWTLLLVGPRVRTWGYWEPLEELEPGTIGNEWVWTEFNRHAHAIEFDDAMKRRAAK